MSVPLIINGVTFNYPVQFDTNWGPTLTNWSTAVTNGMLQTSGANAAVFIKSATSNPSSTGILRLARVDSVGWRNAANSGDLLLSVDGSNNLLFNGIAVGNPTTLTNTHIFVGNVSNVPTDVAMSGDVHISNTGTMVIQSGVIHNSNIAANTITEANIEVGTLTTTSLSLTAGIQTSKLAALNAFITPVTDSSGFLTNSTTTATELSYVHGVTSNIQTQINAITGAGTFTSGMMMLYGAASAPSGWLLCDGTAVSRTTYSSLFGVIGTSYGVGNGTTTFNVPNLVNSVPVGYGGSIAASLGTAAGAATVTPTAQSHTHTSNTHTHVLGSSGTHASVNYTAADDVGDDANSSHALRAVTAGGGETLTVRTALTGTQSDTGMSSTTVTMNASSVVQPSLGVNYIIKT